MKTSWMTLAILLWTFLLPAQTNRPIRLAIVPQGAEVREATDILTADFSKTDKVQLLERAQIEQVYREQELSARNQDYLKLGQVLGADGLLLVTAEETNRFVAVELIAVKPGVLLLHERFAWPLKNPVPWALAVEKLVAPLTPKLGVPAKDAVPISILNLRSSIQSTESRDAERQLTVLAIERLSREPRLFVLERRRMQLLTSEKELKGLDDSAFWDGSYLLDGALDNNGYSKDVMTINARLVPPKGGRAPELIEVRGSRTNYTEIINQLTDKLLAKLNVAQSVAPWNAAEEAEQFYAEAQWALKWELYPQARAAAESAWALGKRNSDSAGILFEAYTRGIPDRSLNPSLISAQAFPDADQFAPVARTLGILSQNATEFFCNSNASVPERFSLGFDALWLAAKHLESYYYNAEARVGHEEQLADLRSQMRAAFKAMDAHPMFLTNRPWVAQQVQEKFDHLKWDEGGACFEHPKEALPFYRELIHGGAHPEHLPRIIGWTWADRQQAPRLLKEFVREVCVATNPATRLEGLYLALLLAPDDEQGSLPRAERDLISALWENREVLFASPASASLVDRATEALRRMDYEDDANRPYSREPFASFKHRLRMDFVEHATVTNLGVYWEFFQRHVGPQAETPEQARELLPLMVSYQQRLPSPQALETTIARLHSEAGIPLVDSNKIDTPPAQDVLEAKFIPWKLKRPGIDPNRAPTFFGTILRHGELWSMVHYNATGSGSSPFDYKVTYLAVDPQSGVKDEIPFPAELGTPGILFEASDNTLFVESGGHLYAYVFKQKTWTEISAPMEGSTRLVWLKDHLYISRKDGLLAVQPESKSAQLLVSTRRQPPANTVDPLWAPDTWIYAQSDGRLGALTGNRCFTFDPATGQWQSRTMPFGTNGYSGLTAEFSSPGGSQWLLTGPVSRHYLVGFWNDGQPGESLLMENAPFQASSPLPETVMKPIRWDWPTLFSLEPCEVHAEDNQLWVLCPRQMSPMYGFVLKKPIPFSDDRVATLFFFEPQFRQPLAVPVKFESNGPNADPFNPPVSEIFHFSSRWFTHQGNKDLWTKTPAGLVLATTYNCGHWLFSDAVLKPRLAAQREELHRPSIPPSSNEAKAEKP